MHASLSSGAITLKEIQDNVEIENCIFINTTAVNNGGALYLDMNGDIDISSNTEVIVKNNTFIKSSANFGGAILQLGGTLTIIDSKFLENTAAYDGAAIYVSLTNLKLNNSQLTSNKIIEQKLFNGGGIYCDKRGY